MLESQPGFHEQRDTVPDPFADINSGIIKKYICQKDKLRCNHVARATLM